MKRGNFRFDQKSSAHVGSHDQRHSGWWGEWDGEGFFSQPLYFTVGGWPSVLFMGLGSGIGYCLWLWALSQLR